MNKFYNKTIKQKMILALMLVVILFNFIMPTYSHADIDWGGALLGPITSFICGISDAVLNFLQGTFLEGAPAAVEYRSEAELKANGIISKGVATVAGFLANHPVYSGIGAGVASGAAAGAAFGPVGALVGGAAGGIGTWLFGSSDAMDYFRDHPFPLIQYSPSAIFSNKIPVFDVNFINPNYIYAENLKQKYDAIKQKLEEKAEKILANKNAAADKKAWAKEVKDNIKKLPKPQITGGLLNIITGTISGISSAYVLNNSIISGEKLGIDLGITESITTSPATASILRNTISKWYINLRNIAIVGLLSVLIYIGIRILLSSASQEKAKYKTMLKDWLIGMCLVFFMHYIMAFILKGAETLIEIFSINGEYDEIMNTVRLMANADDVSNEVAGTLIYAVLVFYTVMFTWQYFKRTVYMAFLTVIAPLVALTYPIDKINDGKAQAFDMWFKEYFFNAILQPVHLLLYTILITSAMTLVEVNPIYALVAIGFMTQAEKIIKKMFGFNKAEGGGLAAGLTGGALFSSGLGLLQKGASKMGGNSSKGAGGSSAEKSKPHFFKTAESESAKDLKAFSGTNPDGIGAGFTTPGLSGGSSGDASGSSGRILKPSRGVSIRGAKLNQNPSLQAASARLRNSISPATALNTNISRPTKKNNSMISRVVRGGRKAGTKVLRSPIGRVGRGVGQVAKKYVLNKDFAKKAGRAAIKTYGAATLGAVGVAAGLASDDYLNVAKMGSAGIGAGILAGGAADNAVNSLASGAVNVKDTFQEGYYDPEEYRQRETKKAIKEYMKDEATEKHFRAEHGSKYKEAMKTAGELIQHGVRDQKDIDTAIKLIDKNEGLSVKEAASIMQFKNKVTQDQLMDGEKREKVHDYVHSLTGNEEGTQKVMNLVDQVYNVKAPPRRKSKANDGNTTSNQPKSIYFSKQDREK